MLYFPQLVSGSVAQFPVEKYYTTRTIVNTCEDGHAVKYFDAGASTEEWTLLLRDLSDSELNTLQTFVASCEGQLQPFVFLDPAGNLLTWSDTLSEAVWQATSALQVETGIDDPFGGTGASRLINASAADLTLQQTVNAPGWFMYCLSVYARTGSATATTFLQSGSSTSSLTVGASNSWTRVSHAATLNTTAASLSAGVVVPAGQSVDVYGFQLEPQPGASAYKRSFGTGGVYPVAHLASDTFTFTTDAPNRHHCKIQILVP